MITPVAFETIQYRTYIIFAVMLVFYLHSMPDNANNIL